MLLLARWYVRRETSHPVDWSESSATAMAPSTNITKANTAYFLGFVIGSTSRPKMLRLSPMLVPTNPPTNEGFSKIMSSITSPNPRVAIARLIPRSRTAGTAIKAPIGMVPTTPMTTARRNGMWVTAISRPAINAPTPAKAN